MNALDNCLNNTWKMWKGTSLVIHIFIGLIIGAAVGILCPQWTAIALLGTMFVGALKAIAPVLVAVLVVSSIAKAQSGLGRRFRSVILLYLSTTLLAAMVAVFASMMFPMTIALEGSAEGAAPGGLDDVFNTLALNLVSNPLQAIASANYIGVLFWGIVIGLALKKKASQNTIQVIDDFAQVVSTAVRWVIQFAPFGVMGLVYKSVSESGMGIFTIYGKLVLLLVGCMLFVALVLNPLVVFVFTRSNPYPLVFRCLKDSGLNAFFTRSSAANIPVNLALCERLGLDKDFYSVCIPLGSTVNMNGAAITITVMTLTVCHTMGIEVGLPTALLLCSLATLGACGASGVAGGSLLLVPMSCSLFGIGNDIAMQAVAVGFIISVIQDSFETALNSSSDVVFAATAEIMEKHKDS